MKQVATHTILDYLGRRQQEMISFLEELVLVESPTAVPAAQVEILNILQRRLEALDFRVLKMPGNQSGGYLLGRPNKRVKAQPIQLLIGHCDTVWPLKTLTSMPLQSADHQLRGPGVYDMKAGLTQIIFALSAIRELELPMPISPVVLINSDEERGSRDSTPAIRRLAKIARRAFILEPPLGLDGKLKTARKGLGRFTITVKGKPAHAGLDPEQGASAILELSRQVQQLFALNDPDRGISVNVGMIEGGVQPNVVAPLASATADVRVLSPEDAEWITAAIHGLRPVDPNTQLSIEGGIGRPPMEKTDRNRRLWLAARQLGQQIGLDLEEATAGGGSDGNTTSLYTATLDGLGTVGDGAHARHEFIFIDTLVERTALLTNLLLMK